MWFAAKFAIIRHSDGLEVDSIMGVNIFILQRRLVRLSVGGVAQSVGSLRRFWKITELDGERAADLDAEESAARAISSPAAAMVADVDEIPLGSKDGPTAKAHLVIGWDEGRTRVTDMGWDYLPTLGYGVRDREGGAFVFHEEMDGALHPVTQDRAAALGLIGPGGRLVRRGQPTIIECRSVRPYIAEYAEADCTFDSGKIEKLLIGVTGSELPAPSWLVGKIPMQVVQYPPPAPR